MGWRGHQNTHKTAIFVYALDNVYDVVHRTAVLVNLKGVEQASLGQEPPAMVSGIAPLYRPFSYPFPTPTRGAVACVIHLQEGRVR